ncbi:MAG: VOC family protein [Bacilli bacterium]|jgi:lactoylglutathione lyase|nr:VOC family protein [Bacilli bacterium]
MIDHLCLNVKDIEKEKDFYCKYFGLIPSKKYHNDKTGWENYFLSFLEGGTRLELLSHKELKFKHTDRNSTCLVHFSFSLGSQIKVEELTERLKKDGYQILSQPRLTGDNYYESSLLDPEGNMIELTV